MMFAPSTLIHEQRRSSQACGSLVNTAISGLGCSLPHGRLTNDELAERIDTSHEWIMSRTGIAARHIADADEATSDLGIRAGQAALAEAGIGADAIDLVLCATATPDQLVPSTASFIQHALGAKNAAAMDLNAGCSGFVYGLHTAAAFLESGLHRNILLVGAETLSKFMNYDDRASCILFGDGAGAAVLSNRGRFELLHSAIGSDGRYADLISIPAGGSREPASEQTVRDKRHCVHLQGNAVFRLAVRHMVQAAREGLAATGLTVDDLDLVVPHQANARIIEAVGEALGVNSSRVVIDLEETGNTSAASLPIALFRHQQQCGFKSGQNVMLLSFGAGVTWGCQVMRVH